MLQKIKNKIHLLESWFFTYLYRSPITRVKPIFVTGSDGKTTTSYFIYNVLNTSGHKTGLLSTVEARAGDKLMETGLHTTTPAGPELQQILVELCRENIEFLVLEVTSHAIDQHRIVGAPPIAAVFTNITREHLDYFKTYDKLVETKAKIIPISAKTFLNKFADITPTLEKIARNAKKPYELYDRELLRDKLSDAWKQKFPGDYNLENAAAAYYLAKDFGIPEEKILEGLEVSEPPVGRFNEIKNDRGIKVVVDFAHTPKAIEEVLKAARSFTKHNLIIVFGSAGLRDQQKRPIMGEAAGKFADFVVLTSEDPRTEKVGDIISQIEAGLKTCNKNYLIEPDRQKAIYRAINEVAKEGDLVIITGKGHEKSMCYGHNEYAWSDVLAVEKALKKDETPIINFKEQR